MRPAVRFDQLHQGLPRADRRIHRDRPILQQRPRCLSCAFEAETRDTLVFSAPSKGTGDEVRGIGENPLLAGIEAYHLH